MDQNGKSLHALSGLIPKYVREVEIPSTAIRICPNAFAGCRNLQQIDLSETKVKQIGKDAFYRSGISSIQFPDCLERIEDGAFEECENLKFIDLSSTSVTEIGRDAFSGWYGYDPYDVEYHSRISGIEEVLLPKSIEKIGEGAFVLCPLKRVTVPRKFEEYFNNIKNPHEFLVDHPQKPTIEYIEDVNDKSKSKNKMLQPRDGSLREKLKMLKSENLRNEVLKKLEATIEPEISSNIQFEIGT